MAINLDPMQFVTKSPPIPQIRMGVIGAPGTGKTTAIINTFPNILVINYDKKLPPGVPEIDITNPEVYKKFVDPSIPKVAGNFRTAFRNFLEFYAPALPATTTLLLDSWTSMMNLLDGWQEANKTDVYWSSKKNEVDGYALHGDRLLYAIEITNLLKALPCHVVITMHEQRERDKEGNLTSDIKPLMKGQFADQMAAHLTTFVRAGWKKDYPKNNGYVWRVTPDEQFKPILPPGFKAPDASGVIPATYNDYIKCFIP